MLRTVHTLMLNLSLFTIFRESTFSFRTMQKESFEWFSHQYPRRNNLILLRTGAFVRFNFQIIVEETMVVNQNHSKNTTPLNAYDEMIRMDTIKMALYPRKMVISQFPVDQNASISSPRTTLSSSPSPVDHERSYPSAFKLKLLELFYFS